ncbi:MAG: tetratricopeptide repeat protein [Spirochaetia bacterium]|nr:tetratricopeptide repeat protein [Spirochaetia bacterium]
MKTDNFLKRLYLKLNFYNSQPIYRFIFLYFFLFIAYSNTFNVPFIFDDNAKIIENPFIQKLSYYYNFNEAQKLGQMKNPIPFKLEGADLYVSFKNRFFTFFTLALNYKIHKFNVTGYHVFNFFIHAITVFFVYQLILLLFQSAYRFNDKKESHLDKTKASHAAFLAAAIFALHPVQTQSVTYTIQRLASLTALFYIGSFMFYIRHLLSAEKRESNKFYVLSFIFGLIAMKCKENAFTLPVSIFLFDYFFSKKESFSSYIKNRIYKFLPFLLLLAVIPVTLLSNINLTGELQNTDDAFRLESDLSRTEYLFTQFRVIVTYFRLLIFPVNQNLDYDYPVYRTFFNLEVILSFIFLAAVFMGGMYLLFRRSGAYKIAGFGILFFFVALSVESSIVPIKDVIFEHRLYLPITGILIFIACLYYELMNNQKYKNLQNWTAVFFIAVIFSLTALTYARNNIWKDGESIWRDTVSKSPQKPRVLVNLANILQTKGKTKEAAEVFKKAVSFDSNLIIARYNLGIALFTLGETPEALTAFGSILEKKPNFLFTKYDMCYSLYQRQRHETAMSCYENIKRLFTNNIDLHFIMSQIYFKLNKKEEGIKELNEILKIDPKNKGALLFLKNARKNL